MRYKAVLRQLVLAASTKEISHRFAHEPVVRGEAK